MGPPERPPTDETQNVEASLSQKLVSARLALGSFGSLQMLRKTPARSSEILFEVHGVASSPLWGGIESSQLNHSNTVYSELNHSKIFQDVVRVPGGLWSHPRGL